MAVGWRGQYYKYREFSLNLLAIYKQRADVQAFLEIILSLVTLIVFIVFAIKPTALTMISLNKEIGSKESTLSVLNQKISDLQTANSVYAGNAATIPNIDAAIFTLPKPDTVAKQVLAVGLKNSVTISGLSIGQAMILGQSKENTDSSPSALDLKALPNGAKALVVSINVKGDYSNLVAFLMDLEKLRIPVKIDDLTINSSQLVSESTLTLTELINARIPYLGKQ